MSTTNMMISDLPRKNSYIKNKILLSALACILAVFGFLPILFVVKIGMGGVWLALVVYGISVLVAVLIIGFIVKSNKKFLHQAKFNENKIIENIGDAVIRFDENGEIGFISNSSKKLFACQKYELAGTGLFDRTHVLDRPIYLKAFDIVKNEAKKQIISIRMRRDNLTPNHSVAEYIWVEISLCVINENAGVLAVFRDVNAQKLAEEKKLESIEVEKREHDSRTQFLAMIGHELRTPLNAIVGFSDMMMAKIGGELEPKQMEYAKLISQSGHHLLDVVNSLMDMARIDAGKFEINAKRFNPSDLLGPCLKIISKAASEKKVNVEVKASSDLPYILADERACRQIMINLLSNAVKFSHSGGSVVCSIKRQGNYLNFSIKDDGIGIDEKHIAKLGEPFLQAHTGLKRNYEGTGLGISIVKGLVELHQGRFEVQSEQGVGTKISVLLPINGQQNNDENANVALLNLPDTKKLYINNENRKIEKRVS